MKLVKATEGVYYDAKNHFGVWGVKKFTDAETENLSVSVSEFLPNGGALMTASNKERVYMVLRGTMDVLGDNDAVFSMEEGDMIYIPAGENREIKVTGNISCRLLVIIVNV